MKQKIKDFLNASVFVRMLMRLQSALGAFFASSAIGAWFGDERVRTRWQDKLLSRVIAGRLGDLIRSSFLLKLLLKIPNLPFISLMITMAGAMCLPTLAVMLLSLVTLALTVIALFFGTEKLPRLPDGILIWAVWALVILVYTFIGFGGSVGMLSGGIRFVMLPMLPCAFILLSASGRMWSFARGLTALSLPVGLYGLYQFFAGQLDAKWTDTNLFSEDFGRLASTFENPNIYGEFLLIVLPVAIVVCRYARGWRQKTFFIGTTVVLLANLFLTYSRGCYVALAVSLFIILGCIDRRFLWLGVGALAVSPLYLPASVMQRIQSIGNLGDSSVAYRINIWKGCLAMVRRFWWVGVGMGDAAFRSVYERYALQTVEDAPHAHNLFLQILCESGVVGLAVLVLLLILLFRSGISNVRHRLHGAEKWLAVALMAAWIGLMIQGLTDYIFYNNNLFCIMMISLGALAARGKERQDV